MSASLLDPTYLAILAPFAAAAVAPWLHARMGHKAGWLLAIIPALMFMQFASFIPDIAAGKRHLFSLPWLPDFGVTFSFYLDGLSLLFALLISGIGTFIVIYAGGYLHGHERLGRFFSFILMFMGAMMGVVLANNIITLFIYWELTSITSFLLIGFNNTKEASRRAAIQALVVTGAGGLALLAGFLLLGLTAGSLEMHELLAKGGLIKDHALYVPILLLILGGAFSKSAQFPLHFWLPNAMEAPTPVSAYLHSATMVKAGVYLLMRVHPILGDTVLWSTILPVFGGATLLVGTILAVRQTDLKLMLAYTTVASLGLLVMLVGTSVEMAIEGAVLYLLAHSLFKGGLFMVAGILDHEAGTRDIRALGGLRKAMPITFFAAALAGLSMAGLPPFVGFLAKESIYAGIFSGDPRHIALTITAILGNGLMLVIGAAIAIKPFLGEKVETPKHAHEGPSMLWLGPLTLSILGLLLGLVAHWTGTTFIAPMVSAITNHKANVDLHLWHGFSMPLLLSAITVGFGIAVFLSLDTARNIIAKVLKAIGWGPDQGFDQVMRGIVRFATGATRILQSGRLDYYLFATFILLAIALHVPIWLFGGMPAWPSFPDLHVYEWGILAIAVIGLGAVLYARTRLVAIVSLGIQGFAVALLFMLFGAPDLSFTQFMVETLSVVILALVLTRLNLKERDHRSTSLMVRDLAVALAVGLGFMFVLLAITQQAFDSRLSDFFTAFSRPIAHGRNIVNVIIVDFRGLDTLGEIAVVMMAALSILALIRIRSPKEDRTTGRDSGKTAMAAAGKEEIKA